MRNALFSALAAGLIALSPLGAAAETIALFPVKFLDTSKESRDQNDEHERRLALISKVVAEGLAQASQVEQLDAETVAAACTPEKVPCLIELAKTRKADVAVFLVIHKSSTLIMQQFVQVVDLKAEKVIYDRNVSFRGDSDQSWEKAGGFLAREINRALATAKSGG